MTKADEIKKVRSIPFENIVILSNIHSIIQGIGYFEYIVKLGGQNSAYCIVQLLLADSIQL